MIKLTESPLNIDDAFSLNSILINLCSQYWQQPNTLTVCALIGNAKLLTADTLIFYPLLCKEIRKRFRSQGYSFSIPFEEIKLCRARGLQNTIESLKDLNHKLTQEKQKKSILDSQFNNLVRLYGQKKEMPLYLGSKPYYSGHYPNSPLKPRLLNISGVRYFTCTHNEKFQTPLYKLDDLAVRNLLRVNFETHPEIAESQTLVGGIMNTTIFIFRCKKTYTLKGKIYYYDLWTNTLLTRLSEVKKIASKYSKNFILDNWEITT